MCFIKGKVLKKNEKRLGKNAKKILSLLLSFLFIFSCFSINVRGAEARKVILALGDSISAGYGLEDVKTECFVNNILLQNGVVVNKAVSGNTAKDILNQIRNAENEKYVSLSQIQSADYVTITCGGNDLMALLYKRTAEVWNESNPNSQILPNEVPLKMMNMHFGVLLTIMELLNPDSELFLVKDEFFDNALNEYFKNIGEITSYINSVNLKAAIIVSTQYNPYTEFKGTNYDIVYRGMEAGVTKLNDAIKEKSKELGYIVSDVKNAFDLYDGDGDLYNADIATTNLDFHPSAEGHKVLAESFKKTFSEIVYVKYYVCHYYEALDGTFEEKKINYETVNGKKITAKENVLDGFSYIDGSENEIKTLYVEDGSVFKLYYSRNTYKVGWHTSDDIIFETYKYGEKIKEPTPKRKGYVFRAWDKELVEYMPAKDITFVAMWDKKSNTWIVLVVLGIVVAAGAIVYIIHLKESSVEKRKKSNS